MCKDNAAKFLVTTASDNSFHLRHAPTNEESDETSRVYDQLQATIHKHTRSIKLVRPERHEHTSPVLPKMSKNTRLRR